MSKDTQSPVILRWETQPIDNKENIKHKILEVQKKTEKLPQKSMNSDGDIKITKKLTSTGAIPKYFGEITNNPIRPTKLSRRRGTTSDSLTNNQIDNKIYTKTKFEIFDEHNVPCAHSTTTDDNRHEAFRKAKEFFEHGTQDNDQFDIKKKKFVKINESPVKKQPKHQRIRQLISEERVADDGVTPHDVGPPELDKVSE
uniref:Uncharacterized protein n=1 Tax=Bracon brevicornis TaxID=1563983 RepID=A0A6V7JJQ3_9HYME